MPLSNLPTALVEWIDTAIILGIIVKEWESVGLPLSHVWSSQLGIVAAYEKISFRIIIIIIRLIDIVRNGTDILSHIKSP